MRYREMQREDVDEILRVRTLTRENALSMDELAARGITPESTRLLLGDDVKGWVCEEGGAILGFAMGDARSGEVLVLAVLPQHEGRGIGRELLGSTVDWLFSRGHRELWLLTNPDPAVRSHGFYRRLGWRPTGERRGEEEVLALRRDRQGRSPGPDPHRTRAPQRMPARLRTTFGWLVIAQVAHSAEEYIGRLWESFPPARLLTGLVSTDREVGFLVLNFGLAVFGLWCWAIPLRRSTTLAYGVAWFWVVLELVNGIGHPLWSLANGGYTPGVATAPILLILALLLARSLGRDMAGR